MNKTLLRCASV